jgi:hypothetical protein
VSSPPAAPHAGASASLGGTAAPSARTGASLPRTGGESGSGTAEACARTWRGRGANAVHVGGTAATARDLLALHRLMTLPVRPGYGPRSL